MAQLQFQTIDKGYFVILQIIEILQGETTRFIDGKKVVTVEDYEEVIIQFGRKFDNQEQAQNFAKTAKAKQILKFFDKEKLLKELY